MIILRLNTECRFNPAFYNDGKTAGQMAYLRFAPKVVDNGYKLTDLDSETIDGKVFTRKLFRHSISVRFNRPGIIRRRQQLC